MLNKSSSGVVMKRFLTIIASAVLLTSCSFNNEWVDQSKATTGTGTGHGYSGWNNN
jgi:hypothetical protein